MVTKMVVFFLVLLLTFSIVSAGNIFFPDLTPWQFVNKESILFKENNSPQIFFESYFNSIITEEVVNVINPIVREEELKPLEISITKSGFDPQKFSVQVGQEIIWKNDRSNLPALLMGLREIISMKSDSLNPGETFIWKFSEPGKYNYVDGIIIGVYGQIIVE